MADHRITPPWYAKQDKVGSVIAECMSDGQKRYLTQWADTYMRHHHIHLHAQTGYKPAKNPQMS